jgi:hypothetical protein
MTPSQVFGQLPADVARSVTDFLYSPARGANVDRLSRWVPAGIDPSQPGPARTLAGLLGAADAELNPAQPLHRLALLPQPQLARLARRIAIDGLEWALRRVIRNTELARLDEWVTQDDWHRIYQSPPTHPVTDRRLVGDIDAIVEALQQRGWRLIERASEALPRALGLRLLLKCPLFDEATGSAPGSGGPDEVNVVIRSYSTWIESALPGWDSALTGLAATTRG